MALVLLPNLWRYSLLRCNLASRAENYPNSLLVAMAVFGRKREAIDLAELISAPPRKAVVLAEIGARLAQAEGLSEGARSLFRRSIEIVTSQSNSTGDIGVWEIVVTTFLENRLWNEAAEIVNKINRRANQASLWAMIAVSLVGVEDEAAGQEFLKKALDATMDILDQREQAHALRDVVDGLARAGQFTEALDSAHQLTDNGERARVLGQIASALVAAHQVDMGGKVFDEALAATRQIGSKLARVEALGHVASALVMAQRVDEGLGIFDEAVELAGQHRDEFIRGWMLKSIAALLAKAARFDTALNLACQIGDELGRVEALGNVAAELARAARFDTALAAARQIQHDWKRAETLGHIADALVTAQRVDDGKIIFEEALALTSQIRSEGGKERTMALVSIGEALVDVTGGIKCRHVGEIV